MRRVLATLLLVTGCEADAPSGGARDGGAGDDAEFVDDAGPEIDADVSVPDVLGVPTGCVAGRATADRPDDTPYDQLRVLYVTPSDGPDLQRDTSGILCNSVRGIATWFEGQAGAALRLDTAGGLLDIGFVRLGKTDAQMRGTDATNLSIDTGIAFVRERIERELRAAGMIAANKLYAVYYEGTSSYACGGGAYPPLIVGRVGAMYLRAPSGASTCADVRPWGRASLVPEYIDYGMLHETLHSMGYVPAAALNQHSAGHAYDTTAAEPARDILYSPRPGQPDPPWAVAHPGGLLLDINGDDYFGTSSTRDLSRSSLLAPRPANARPPVGW